MFSEKNHTKTKESIPIITTTSIAKWVAITEPIILRANSNTRLIFEPLIIDTDKKQGVRWVFKFQRKWKKDNWEDFEYTSLSTLRSWEEYKLELRSEELWLFIKEIFTRKELQEQIWVQYGENCFVIANENIEKFLTNIWHQENEENLQNAIKNINSDVINSIENSINIARFEKILEEIKNNLTNCNEKSFWQPLFKRENWILSQIFSSPITFFQEEIYFGWKNYQNQWWVISDYMYNNPISNTITIIEIKNPCEKLIESNLYRWTNPTDLNAVYGLHKDFSWAITQVMNQKHVLQENFKGIQLPNNFKNYNIRSLLIIGKLSDLSESQRKSFELHRDNMKNVDIITFDELYTKIEYMISLLKGDKKINKIEKIDTNIPF